MARSLGLSIPFAAANAARQRHVHAAIGDDSKHCFRGDPDCYFSAFFCWDSQMS